MTQGQLNRAVARATGESVRTILARGFGLMTNDFEEREPLVFDWDQRDATRYGAFPETLSRAAGP